MELVRKRNDSEMIINGCSYLQNENAPEFAQINLMQENSTYVIYRISIRMNNADINIGVDAHSIKTLSYRDTEIHR